MSVAVEKELVFKTKFRDFEYNDKYKIEIYAHVITCGMTPILHYRFILTHKSEGKWWPVSNLYMETKEKAVLQYLWTIQNYMLSIDIGDNPAYLNTERKLKNA